MNQETREARTIPMSSVSYKTSSLTFADIARLCVQASFPRARRPLGCCFLLVAYVFFSLGFVGFLIGTIGSPNITPEKCALAFAAFGILIPVRFLVGVTRNSRVLRSRGQTTLEVDENGLIRRSGHRFTHHDWAGVVEIRQTRKDLMFLFDMGDFAWLPRWAFLDPEHEARFLEIARDGLASASRASAPSSETWDR